MDDIYKEALENIKYKRPSTKPNAGTASVAEQEQAAKDYYANVRTNLLLTWVLSNAILLLAILGGGDAVTTFSSDNSFSRTQAYMTFILAFVAVTTIIVSWLHSSSEGCRSRAVYQALPRVDDVPHCARLHGVRHLFI